MAELLNQQGYFSVLRWRTDVTRDEAHNVAVVLVERKGRFGGLRAAPLSSVSTRLRDQGILDAMIVSLQRRFEAKSKPDVEALRALSESLQHSVCLTPPSPVAVTDVDAVLSALYKAYIAPRVAGGQLTKGRLLDRVIEGLRRRGVEIKRGEVIGDFVFDGALVQGSKESVVEVLSFATAALDWRPVERDAGYFLYAQDKVKFPGVAVIQPPADSSRSSAHASYERVVRWFGDEGVSVFEPDRLSDLLHA